MSRQSHMGDYRVRFAWDDPEESPFAWQNLSASSWKEAAEKFAQRDCAADGDSVQDWLAGARDLIVEDVGSGESKRVSVEGEAVMRFDIFLTEFAEEVVS